MPTPKHNPATALPWEFLPDEGQFIVDGRRGIVAEIPCQGCEPDDGHYIVHACNAYPKFVEFVKLVAQTKGLQDRYAPMLADARALLHSLGEDQ